MKYLRISIDDRQRLTDHYDYIIKEMCKKISFLNRIGKSTTMYARCVIYTSTIAPHFDYSATLIINV